MSNDKITEKAAKACSEYFALCGRNYDEDLQSVSIENGCFYSDAIELFYAIDGGNEEAKKVHAAMMDFKQEKTKFFPSDAKIAKDLAECMWNTRIECPRVRPFYESSLLFTQNEAFDILSKYGVEAANPLAYAFDDSPNKYLSVIVTKTKLGLSRGNGYGKYVVTDVPLIAYGSKDRTRRVDVHKYSPLAWGLLKRGDFEAMKERLKPLVEDYLIKILNSYEK